MTACSIPKIAADSAEWISVDNERFHLNFSYPSSWGQWFSNESSTDAIVSNSFTELDRTIRVPYEGSGHDVNISFQRYDGLYRYKEVCTGTGGLEDCSTTNVMDLLVEKNEFMQKTTKTVNGIPIIIKDYYDAESGFLARDVQFYTPTHKVHIDASYDIGDFLSIHGPGYRSLYDIAQQILGSDLSNPINRLSGMYPEELQEMTEFYQNVDLFLKSIKIPE